MAILTSASIAAILAAAGIILVVGLITYDIIKDKLRNRDFFKALISKKAKTAGIPVVTVELFDEFDNSVDELKLASSEGIDVSIGTSIYKNQI